MRRSKPGPGARLEVISDLAGLDLDAARREGRAGGVHVRNRGGESGGGGWAGGYDSRLFACVANTCGLEICTHTHTHNIIGIGCA